MTAAGVELAINSLTRKETALFVVPAELMAPPPGASCTLPAPPKRAGEQIELQLQLVSIVQVCSDCGFTGRA